MRPHRPRRDGGRGTGEAGQARPLQATRDGSNFKLRHYPAAMHHLTGSQVPRPRACEPRWRPFPSRPVKGVSATPGKCGPARRFRNRPYGREVAPRERAPHSITSSTRARSEGGIVRPSVFAVFI
jgi:hypothetical protein